MDTRAGCELTENCFYLEGHSGCCNAQDTFLDRSTVLVNKAFVTQPCYAACQVGQPHKGPCITSRGRAPAMPRCEKYEPQASCSLTSLHEGACALTPNNPPKTDDERPSVTEAFKEVSRALDGLTKEEAARVLRAVAVLMDIKL